jgi:hypothetical protein
MANMFLPLIAKKPVGKATRKGLFGLPTILQR